MDGQEILKQILFGGSISDKLTGSQSPWSELSWSKEGALEAVVEVPGRSNLLKLAEKSSSVFPKKSELKNESARGRLIHFFANHELLAIESMAYVLLKFPNAEESFRQGVFRTLQDEQKHFQAYLNRMRECGVDFGAVPLNLYFWNSLKNMKSPLDYVTQMSLTFEQANLDFSLEYAKFFEEEIADEKTARLLREVHDDEVKHVAHGMKWFREWQNPALSEFEAYQAQLPFPMTPRRAKGSLFFSEESRRQAGMSEEFIDSIRVAGGSRGKVPHYYYFNPECEVEGALQTLPKHFLEKILDLRPLMIWLTGEEDVVELDQVPPLSWLKELHSLRGELPEFILEKENLKRYIAFDEFKPWGFSESAWRKWKAIEPLTRSKPIFKEGLHREKLFSKNYWKQFLGGAGTAIRSASDLDAFLPVLKNSKTDTDWLVKTDQSTSGRGHFRIPFDQRNDPSLLQKLYRRVEKKESFVIEPFLNKIQDFSVQYEIRPDGKILEFEPRVFRIDSQFQYRGAILGRPVYPYSDIRGQAWLQIQKEKERWQEAHRKVLEHLKSLHYSGPLGIDCLVYQNEDQSLLVEPVIEVNVRFTMGRVALAIEEAFHKKGLKSGIFRLLNSTDLLKFGVQSFQELNAKLKTEFGAAMIAATPLEPKPQTWGFAIATSQLDSDLIERFLS